MCRLHAVVSEEDAEEVEVGEDPEEGWENEGGGLDKCEERGSEVRPRRGGQVEVVAGCLTLRATLARVRLVLVVVGFNEF